MGPDLPVGDSLAHECHVFCRYLVRSSAPPDVLDAYRRAHAMGSVAPDERLSALDRSLLRVASMGPLWVRLADAYAALFARASLLRRKIVLMVAILETRGSSAAVLDTATPGSRAGLVADLTLRASFAVVQLVIAAVVISPLTIWYGLNSRPDASERREPEAPAG
jgi:hypothetical protein